MSLPGWKLSNMLFGKSRGQLLIAPERMKQLGQSRNDTQFWMCLLMKVKSDAIKNWNVRNWNVRSMNQGKLDVVKQEMAKVNKDILGISELKWMGMGEFNSYDQVNPGYYSIQGRAFFQLINDIKIVLKRCLVSSRK